MNQRIVQIVAGGVSSIILAACMSGTKVEKSTIVKKPTMEPLHAVSITDSTITISVTSNGCTKKEHFDFVADAEHSHQFIVVRNKYDGCRRVPERLSFKYAFSEIGLAEKIDVTIKNPIIAFKKQGFSSGKNN